jgi:hypothetical protein
MDFNRPAPQPVEKLFENTHKMLGKICYSQSGDYEEFCPVGYNSVQSAKIQQTTRRYTSEDGTIQNVLCSMHLSGSS